jgi:histidinol-phosphatase (PHP family)
VVPSYCWRKRASEFGPFLLSLARSRAIASLSLLYMHSHHSHSGAYCAHASPNTSPSSMLTKAYEKGFQLYCLSEHVPRASSSQLYPEEVEAHLKPLDLVHRFEAYLVEARRCVGAWKGKMEVLVGAELENIDEGCIEYLEQRLNGEKANEGKGSAAGRGRIDYLIGSLHHVDGIPIDFDKATFESALDNFRVQKEEGEEAVLRIRAHLRLVLRYLTQQYELLHHFEPEVIGHFDLCRLYRPDLPMTPAAPTLKDKQCSLLIQQVNQAVHRNVALVCSYGGLFEVNSASIRKGWATPYPGSDVIDVIIAQGGRLCLSDDAHAHEQVGLNYHKVKNYLQSKGVATLWKLEAGTDSATNCFQRGTRAVKVLDWQSDPFWHM